MGNDNEVNLKIKQTGAEKVAAALEGITKQLNTLNNRSKRNATTNNKGTQALLRHEAASKRVNAMNKKFKENTEKLRKAMAQMFILRQVNQLLSGMMRPAFDVAQVFEVFSAGLMILFLPAALEVLRWAIAFLNWVNTFSPETKTLIGRLAMFAFVLSLIGIIWSMLAFVGWTDTLALVGKAFFDAEAKAKLFGIAVKALPTVIIFSLVIANWDNIIKGFEILGDNINAFKTGDYEKIGVNIAKMGDMAGATMIDPFNLGYGKALQGSRFQDAAMKYYNERGWDKTTGQPTGQYDMSSGRAGNYTGTSQYEKDRQQYGSSQYEQDAGTKHSEAIFKGKTVDEEWDASGYAVKK